jgi:23S rRNA (cytosine1962-C5)-methyltransferase
MFYEITEFAVSKARRRATILGVYGQPADHPFPLVCRELQYLKFMLLQVR